MMHFRIVITSLLVPIISINADEDQGGLRQQRETTELLKPLLENKESHDLVDIERKNSIKITTVGDRLKKWAQTHDFKGMVEDRRNEWTQRRDFKRETTEMLKQCVSDRSIFDAGWGGCDSYKEGSSFSNYGYCNENIDKKNKHYAINVCSECGKCLDSINIRTKLPTKKKPKSPIKLHTKLPTKSPITSPTNQPTNIPTKLPTKPPTKSPTRLPTKSPTNQPTNIPTKSPTNTPAISPIISIPSVDPSVLPSPCALGGGVEIEGELHAGEAGVDTDCLVPSLGNSGNYYVSSEAKCKDEEAKGNSNHIWYSCKDGQFVNKGSNQCLQYIDKIFIDDEIQVKDCDWDSDKQKFLKKDAKERRVNSNFVYGEASTRTEFRLRAKFGIYHCLSARDCSSLSGHCYVAADDCDKDPRNWFFLKETPKSRFDYWSEKDENDFIFPTLYDEVRKFRSKFHFKCFTTFHQIASVPSVMTSSVKQQNEIPLLHVMMLFLHYGVQ